MPGAGGVLRPSSPRSQLSGPPQEQFPSGLRPTVLTLVTRWGAAPPLASQVQRGSSAPPYPTPTPELCRPLGSGVLSNRDLSSHQLLKAPRLLNPHSHPSCTKRVCSGHSTYAQWDDVKGWCGGRAPKAPLELELLHYVQL